MVIVDMKDKETNAFLGYGVYSPEHDDVISPTFETQAECTAFILGFEFVNEAE